MTTTSVLARPDAQVWRALARLLRGRFARLKTLDEPPTKRSQPEAENFVATSGDLPDWLL